MFYLLRVDVSSLCRRRIAATKLLPHSEMHRDTRHAVVVPNTSSLHTRMIQADRLIRTVSSKREDVLEPGACLKFISPTHSDVSSSCPGQPPRPNSSPHTVMSRIIEIKIIFSIQCHAVSTHAHWDDPRSRISKGAS